MLKRYLPESVGGGCGGWDGMSRYGIRYVNVGGRVICIRGELMWFLLGKSARERLERDSRRGENDGRNSSGESKRKRERERDG